MPRLVNFAEKQKIHFDLDSVRVSDRKQKIKIKYLTGFDRRKL